jgi:hypothetical protein
MPSISFDDTVSGQGSATLSTDRVLYLAFLVTVDGRRVRTPRDADGATLNGVGFVTLGNSLTAAGILVGDAWGPELWLNTRQGQFIADGHEVASAGFMRWIADRFRWSLSEGTSVHIYILGDNA